ncbi:MAG: MFS transporter [Maricaulis sp.]|nr:MFS transporter [Maricaulis sp.]MDG2043842.1 MFS transporter [Maricaulis sp.]
MSSNSIRFAAYYGAFYFTLGAFLPFFPEWLAGRGMEGTWIGYIVAAAMVGRVLVSPLGARWADLSRRKRDPILILSLGSTALFLLHGPTSSPWVLLVLSFLCGAAFYGQMPLIDAFAMGESRRGKITFGPVRAIGSALFIVSNVGAGLAFERFGSESILVWVVIGAMLVSLSAVFLPDGEDPNRRIAPPLETDGLGALLRGPFGIALAASVFVQGAHGFYYYFSAVAWGAQGHGGVVIGLLIASGVVIEIVFLTFSGRGWLGRMSPAMLMGIGAGGSVLRWGLLALSPPLWGLFILQNLHALTYAATYIGFLRYASLHVPDRYAATAQSINSALSGGLVMALAAAASGYLYTRVGSLGFAAMMLPAIAGLGFAVLLSRQRALPRADELD